MPIIDLSSILFYTFALCSLILVFYYLFFFTRLAFYKPKATENNIPQPLTVIVCAKNEDQNLAKNVPGLIFQEYGSPYQTLIVNDNSDDDTKYILQELNKSFNAPLTIVNLEQNAKLIAGKKYPLSIGIREASHEIVLLTDADCVPATEHWVQKMQAGYREGIDIVLGYGAYYKAPGFLNKLIRFETFHTALQYLSYSLAGLTYMGVGRNLSYKKSLFLKNKGFSAINQLPGGDDDLFINKVATKRNTAIVIDKEAHTLSTPKKTWKQWRHQKTRHYSTSKYYKPKFKFLLGLYSLSQFLFYPLLAIAFVVFDWRMVSGVFLFKIILQWFLYARVMKKLNEADLIKWVFIMDLLTFFYYCYFAPSVFKKESKSW